MCALFGFVNYKHLINSKELKKLVNTLAVESEVRGTDASGIAYVKNQSVKILKRAKPAHNMRFYFPTGITALIGHTRMTTQGNEKFNYNNHPFEGKTAEGNFALCHNGVLYNDMQLKKSEKLPDTVIETDSYVAVQLIEKSGRLDFDSIKNVSESVEGSFVFTMLDSKQRLYISKGDNPIYLIHFRQLGLYVYASTEKIMKSALKKTILGRFSYEVIKVSEGEIISIDRSGRLKRAGFDYQDNCSFFRYCGIYDKSYESNDLYSICNMFGITQEELKLLYEIGYTDDDIEILIEDRVLLADCIKEAREYSEAYGEC